MKKTRKQLENAFITLTMIVYSLSLVFGFVISFMFTPYSYEYSYYDYLKMVFLVTHILFIFFSMINWRYQKIVLFINLVFYVITMAFLVWILTENDINIYIYFFIILWLILFVFSFNKFILSIK
jgi:hypothetical protein